MRSVDRVVLTSTDSNGRFVTMPVTIEATGAGLVAVRLPNDSFPASSTKVCLCAHQHGRGYESFKQVVIYGDAQARGREVRIRPFKVLVSTRPPGIIGEFKSGAESSRRSTANLAKWGREPVSMDLLNRAFGSG
ncbi:MAG: hypothetical protein DCC49_04840 [Acidobacteria bacterium]|nr:MAG: hypothetical protein DCC49_04840 [Acidobacteriota bacterium]